MSTLHRGPRHGFPLSTDLIDAACRRWKIRRLDVFGSYLRDDFGPESDIDLLYDFRPDALWGLLHLVAMQEEFASILGRPVDLVSRKAIEASGNYLLRRQILGAAEPIFAEG